MRIIEEDKEVEEVFKEALDDTSNLSLFYYQSKKYD